jgi:hypothetical protein
VLAVRQRGVRVPVVWLLLARCDHRQRSPIAVDQARQRRRQTPGQRVEIPKRDKDIVRPVLEKSGTGRVYTAYTTAMPSDPTFSCRPDPGLATAIDQWAEEIGLPLSTAMMLLMSFGLQSKQRSAVIRHAVQRGFDQRRSGR